MRKRLDNILKM